MRRSPNQKPGKNKTQSKKNPSSRNLTENKTPQILLLWQTFKANYSVDGSSPQTTKTRLPKMRERRKPSTERPNDQVLPFYSR